jgi:hypothetical protein
MVASAFGWGDFPVVGISFDHLRSHHFGLVVFSQDALENQGGDSPIGHSSDDSRHDPSALSAGAREEHGTSTR